jgi:beta-glucosidase
MNKFPQNFLWGAATSSYQVEGGNSNADWWEWEKRVGKENSGDACRHYELYNQDFDLAQGLNHNAHRLSIEWSRIEPKEGEFSQKELQHYIEVLRALRRRNIEPMVTLHHFTTPLWLSQEGGWENPHIVDYFLRYCEFVVRGLAEHVHYWMTINEPTIYVSHSYLFGLWPPQVKSYLRTRKVYNHMIDAHIRGYKLIHRTYRQYNLVKPAVSFAHHMPAIIPCSNSLKNRLAAYLRDRWYNFDLLDKFAKHKTLDFIGFNYYSRHLVHLLRWGLGNLVWDVCTTNHDPVKKNSLGWDIYPEGLYQVLLKLKKYNVPIVISENGICTLDDNLRWEFIRDHLKSVHRAMEEGVNVVGYLYWSLLDNFEWDKGFGPRFGLIEMDYLTQKRTVRESARKLAQVCETGILEE